MFFNYQLRVLLRKLLQCAILVLDFLHILLTIDATLSVRCEIFPLAFASGTFRTFLELFLAHLVFCVFCRGCLGVPVLMAW